MSRASSDTNSSSASRRGSTTRKSASRSTRRRSGRIAATASRCRSSSRTTFPQVEGSIDGIDGVFDIDTGSRTSLTLAAPFAERNKLADKYHATAEVISGAGVGGPARARLARGALLKLGGVDVPAPVTLLSTATSGAFADPALAGNVGFGVLRRFNLVFDYRNEVMWFEKNALFDDKDVHDRAGVWVERGPGGFAIVDVLAGGPAAQAGLKPGDVVKSVDGKPVDGASRSTHFARASRPSPAARSS